MFRTATRRIGLGRFVSDTDGMIMPFGLMLFLLGLTLCGLAIDYANAVKTRAHLQLVADAAAIAAARDLPDTEAAREAALDIAARNSVGPQDGELVAAEDIAFGFWDAEAESFTADATPLNAVRVVASRNRAKANPLQPLMPGLRDGEDWQIEISAIALGRNACVSGGLFSGEKMKIKKENAFIDGFCLYAYEEMKIDKYNTFEEGTTVTVPHLDVLKVKEGGYGLDEALRLGTRSLPLADNVDEILAELRSGSTWRLPPWVTSGPVYLEKIKKDDELVPGTLYIVEKDVDIEDNSIEEVAIVAKKIKVDKEVTLNRVFLAADEDIKIEKEGELGGAGYCANDGYLVTLIAGKKIEIKKDITLRGVLLVAGKEIKMKKAGEMFASYGEAGEKIELDKANTYGGCPQALGTPFAEHPYTLWNVVR